jgi:hypothetical protein
LWKDAFFQYAKDGALFLLILTVLTFAVALEKPPNLVDVILAVTPS